LGVSPPRLSALSVVVFAPPTMSRLVDGLEGDALVRREADPQDARGVLVRATPKGARILTRGRRQRVRTLAEGLARLSPDELDAVAQWTDLIERVTREQ
jgi:DNA-binding MarR family transcriptional regulator